MLSAIEFVKQADGKVGEYFAKRSSNQNAFMQLVITDGVKPSVLDALTVKFGQLILPIQEYKAVGSVYHQLKWPFAEYQQYGVVGTELPADSKKTRAPRKPRESSTTTATTATSPARIALAARHTSRFAARAIVVVARSQEMRNGIAVPDASILTIARNFRASGKTALAQAIESDYLMDFDAAEKARLELRATELSEIIAALVKEYGADAVAAAAAATA